MESWDDLRYFLAVARRGTLSGAARDLGVDHSTVFRRIGAFEERLGARVFERLRRGYALTTVGEEMLARAQAVEEQILGIERQVLGRDLRLSGAVRITTVDTLVTLILGPHLGRFRARYPGIQLEVATSGRFFSLTRREADVAIRPGERPDEQNVVARRLCGLAAGVYASRSYLENHPAIRRPEDLARHDLIVADESLSHLKTARWMAPFAGDNVVFRANTFLSQVAAAKAGIGVGAFPCYLVDREPDLVRVLGPVPEMEGELWLLTHADLRQTARVRAVIDFVTEVVADERRLLEGLPPLPHRGGGRSSGGRKRGKRETTAGRPRSR